MKDKRLVNPNWTRPEDPRDWPYEEDWDSPAWKERMKKVYERAKELRSKYGFITCPKCNTSHTTYTIFCRVCEYKVEGINDPELGRLSNP